MIYIFAIQLVNKHGLQGLTERMRGSKVVAGCLAALVGCAMVMVILLKQHFVSLAIPNKEVPMDLIGDTLMGSEKYQYVLAFEFISVFLLACIIGGIVISRKDK